LKKQQAESIERLMEQGACESKITDVLSKQASKLAKFENETSNNLLTDFGQAMTYRFKRDRKGWRIILSISLENEVNYVTSTANGAIGVDLNEHHISYTEINSRGNKVATDDVYFRDKNYDDTSPQVTTGLGEAVKVLIERAKLSKAPIVIERLDFKKSKSKLKAGQDKKFNKTISSLVTKKFKDILKARCAESSIELISVNPAYTSLIGRLKYANQFDNNVHQAAAMVIARRGAGFLDRKLPKFTMCVVSNKSKYFRIPEDCGEIDISSFFRKVRQQYDTWFLQTLAIIRATRTAPTQRIVLEDINF
jgi:IS605 OrfB family transposase